MSTPSSKVCQNCNVENESPFQFCPNCGQKNTDGKITFSELWAEFKDAVFNIDSRTWQTFKSLFIPGKLTLEYFSGKHRQYVHPLRLLLVTSVLAIIALSFQGFDSATNYTFNIKERILENYERQRLYGILDNITDNTNTIFPEQQTEIITDTIMAVFEDSLQSLLARNYGYGDKYGDSIDLHSYYSFGSEKMEKVSKQDFLKLDEDELAAIYKKNAGILERHFFKQKIKLINDESQLFAVIVRHTTWAVLLMMPCWALILYFLYIRHQYFYIEHLIFTFHLQSFLFIIAAILIGGMNVFPQWIFPVFGAITLIFLFASMWKVYQQSLGRTLSKFVLLTISYGVLFLLILIGTIIISFFLV